MDFLFAGTKKKWPLQSGGCQWGSWTVQYKICNIRRPQNGRRRRVEEEIAFQSTLPHHPKKRLHQWHQYFEICGQAFPFLPSPFIPLFCYPFKFSQQTCVKTLAIYAGYLKCCIVLIMTQNNLPEKTTLGIIHPSKTKLNLWFVWMC